MSDKAGDSDRLDRTVDVLLEEFRIVAGEIANRSQAQYVLLNISIVGSGATAAYVLASHDRAIFALVLSYFGSFLGVMWLDHARVITSKGTYISSNLWPQLRERLRSRDLTSHEDWTRRQDAERTARLLFVMPVMSVFVLPAIAGIVYSFSSVSSPGRWTAWALGTLVTALSIMYWTAFYFNRTILAYIGPPYRPAHPVPDSGAHPIPRRRTHPVSKILGGFRNSRDRQYV
jgi:hypothetical protein